jgi:hypothetical protein
MGIMSCEKLTVSLGATGFSDVQPTKFMELKQRRLAENNRKKTTFLFNFS